MKTLLLLLWSCHPESRCQNTYMLALLAGVIAPSSHVRTMPNAMQGALNGMLASRLQGISAYYVTRLGQNSRVSFSFNQTSRQPSLAVQKRLQQISEHNLDLDTSKTLSDAERQSRWFFKLAKVVQVAGVVTKRPGSALSVATSPSEINCDSIPADSPLSSASSPDGGCLRSSSMCLSLLFRLTMPCSCASQALS